MNYRHAYHAGNFADVLKHAVLALIIEHLKAKPAPFRVIDTHAGSGLYDLASEASQRTGEWRLGIGRVLSSQLPEDVARSLAPYLSAVAEENQDAPGGELRRYPGSPRLARRLLRPGDVVVANELHPEENASLRKLFARDEQTKILALDAWIALKSLLPPKERRGLVLVDPPFEESGELDRMREGLSAVHARFAGGTVMLWYPIKSRAPIRAFHDSLSHLGIAKLLVAEIFIREPVKADELNGCGLVIMNPPYTLEGRLMGLLPFLADVLAQGSHPAHTLSWLAGSQLNSS
jgi:23S rRNA (adenine2030-N6)-methyltransferase